MPRRPHPNRKPGEIPHLMVRGDGVVVNRVIHKEGEPSPVPGHDMVPDPQGEAEWSPGHYVLRRDEDGTFEKIPLPEKPPSSKEIAFDGRKDLAMRLAEIEKQLGINPDRKPPKPAPPILPEPSVE